MMVLGFLSAMLLARFRCRKLNENPEHIVNFGVYALLAGVIGARAMHVLHNWSYYRDHLGEIWATWSGGLEFLGGFLCALVVMIFYFRCKKLPVRKFLDILAPALMLGLAFGRMGCFLNGCCFGGVCELPWAIRFPALNSHTAAGCDKTTFLQYSNPYVYQLGPDPQRRPDQPTLITLPPDFADGYTDGAGNWAASLEAVPTQSRRLYYPNFKNPAQLTDRQIKELKDDRHPMRSIHPAQLYSLVTALLLSIILNALFRRRKYPGQIFASMLILYGVARFLLEMVRTEPLEFNGLSISQNMAVAAFLAGVIMIALLRRQKAKSA